MHQSPHFLKLRQRKTRVFWNSIFEPFSSCVASSPECQNPLHLFPRILQNTPRSWGGRWNCLLMPWALHAASCPLLLLTLRLEELLFLFWSLSGQREAFFCGLLPSSSLVALEELYFIVTPFLRHDYTINYCNVKPEQGADLQLLSCFVLTARVNALCLHYSHWTTSHPSQDERAQASSNPAVPCVLQSHELPYLISS